MYEEDENTTDQNDEFDAAFDEFADGGTPEPTEEPELGPDLEPEPSEQPSGQLRDEMGRFASQGNDGDQDANNPSAEPGSQEETPEQKIARLERESQNWQHRYNSDLGRQSALQKKIDELQAQLNGGGQQRQPNGQPQSESPEGMTDAEWAEIQKDYPGMAKGIEARINSAISQAVKPYQDKITTLEGQFQPIQEQSEREFARAQMANLETEHPDFKDYAFRPGTDLDKMSPGARALNVWLMNKPGPIQKLASSNNAADVAYVLSAFKLETAPATPSPNENLRQRRQRQLDASQTVPHRGGRKTPTAVDDYDAAFDEFADK